MSDSPDEEEVEETKVILVGESGVGKTNLINIITGSQFNPEEGASATASFLNKKLTVKGKEYTIRLWDTIGQESLRHMAKLFYNNSKIVIFVYDITRKKTFEELNNYWVKTIEEKLGKNVIKGVVANKIDLFMNEDVTQEEGKKYADSIGALFLATSAKTDGPGIFEGLLTQLYEQYLKKKEEGPKESDEENNNSIVLKKNKKNNNNNKKKKENDCCLK